MRLPPARPVERGIQRLFHAGLARGPGHSDHARVFAQPRARRAAQRIERGTRIGDTDMRVRHGTIDQQPARALDHRAIDELVPIGEFPGQRDEQVAFHDFAAVGRRARHFEIAAADGAAGRLGDLCRGP